MQNKLELYQKVAPLAGLGVWERNLQTDQSYWNAVVKNILEVPDSYIPLARPSLDFVVDTAAAEKMIAEVTSTGTSQVAELQLRTAKGNLKWVKLRMCADFENGQCTLLYGTLEDISDNIAVTKKLRSSEEQFHRAFDFAPIGMALVSLNGGFLRVNRTLCRLLGYSSEELLQRSFQDLTYQEDLEADLQLLQRLVAGELESYHLEKRYIHNNNGLIWALLHVSLVRDEAGAPLYFVSQIKDISERKQMELERMHTLEIISAQNQRLLNFAHIVSHNLRSHTGNIQMLTELIGNENNAAEREQLIGMLSLNANNLQETLLHLNQVVDVQLQGSQELKPLNLHHEVKKTIDTISVELKQAGAHWHIAIDESLEINYNPAYLDSILLNLLTNTIKYRDQQRALEINVSASKQHGQITLEVSDNGLGIDMERYGHQLFGMYKTFHGNADARGIGLFLVKNQVEVMGGRIRVRSSPGKGTTFSITFRQNQ